MALFAALGTEITALPGRIAAQYRTGFSGLSEHRQHRACGPDYAIGAISAVCFGYAIRHRQPFLAKAVESPTPYYDYILLLGCLTFLIMEGYWHTSTRFSGRAMAWQPSSRWCCFSAWGIGSTTGRTVAGITALASWLGITVTPQELLSKNDFNSATIVYTGVFLGILLTLAAFVGERLNFKKHFSLTYLNFGVHIGTISCLAGMMALDGRPFIFPCSASPSVFICGTPVPGVRSIS